MPKWGIFNASLPLNEHGHPPFLFQNWSYNMTNIRWTKLEQNSTVTFISEELPQGRCLLLLLRTHSAHHARYGLSAKHALVLTMTQSTTLPSTRLNWKRNFPTVTKSSLMSLYLSQEHQNSSISPSTFCYRLPAEKLSVISRKLYWNPTVNMYLQMA